MEENVLDRPDGLMRSEMEVLRELVRTSRAHDVLEVGMANGSSAVSILEVMSQNGSGHVTSIDPFQLHPVGATDGPSGYGGEGVRNIERAGFSSMHTLMPTFDYLAMPDLVRQQRRFDFIFIDGYHSFDYVMVDFFFADLLLRPGGMVVFHDSNQPPVYRVCRFVARNKAYRMIGPPLMLRYPDALRRGARRAVHVATGQAKRFDERRQQWKSLAAFVKERDAIADQFSMAEF